MYFWGLNKKCAGQLCSKKTLCANYNKKNKQPSITYHWFFDNLSCFINGGD